MDLLLSECKLNQTGVVKEVMDNHISTMLAEFGIIPGVEFTVLSRAPFNGPIFIRVDHNRIALRRKEAAFIIVQ